MRRIDKPHLEYLFRGQPNAMGFSERRGHRDRPACRYDDAADGERGDLPLVEHFESHAGQQDLPHLLRELTVDRPNQAWTMDITYIPMARGFVDLAAAIDWVSRGHPGVAGVDRYGRRLLSRRASPRQARHAGHQDRSGITVHQPSLHRPADGQRHRHLHGWKRRLARQRFH